jgi:hypothetical protein
MTLVSTIEWISSHLHVFGWPALIGLVWKFRGSLDTFTNSWNALESTTKVTAETAATIKQNVDVMSSNHLKHIEMSLASMDIRHEKETELLTNIDKGIAILVDRNGRL